MKKVTLSEILKERRWIQYSEGEPLGFYCRSHTQRDVFLEGDFCCWIEDRNGQKRLEFEHLH